MFSNKEQQNPEEAPAHLETLESETLEKRSGKGWFAGCSLALAGLSFAGCGGSEGPYAPTSTTCGIEGEELGQWQMGAQQIVERERTFAGSKAVGETPLLQLKELLLTGDTSLVGYHAIGRQIAFHGGTEARDALLDVLRQDCGGPKPDGFYPDYSLRLNIAREAGLGLTWLLLGDTLTKSEKEDLYSTMKSLSKDSTLAEPVRKGLRSALDEYDDIN